MKYINTKLALLLTLALTITSSAFANESYDCGKKVDGKYVEFGMDVNSSNETLTLTTTDHEFKKIGKRALGIAYCDQKTRETIYVAADFSSITFKDGNGEGGPVLNTYPCQPSVVAPGEIHE